ncbi:MAG: 5-formyltetrahydrofolate cyclo-ligase [Nanoarchaeota archaeon]|nr:MAG: 5-formyltetrahydrofolate cyclo-ligase [Nanoarchaeota archaeon]
MTGVMSTSTGCLMELKLLRKKDFRKRALEMRESISILETIERSSAVQKNLIKLPEFKKAKIVLSYIPIRNEVAADNFGGKGIVLPGFDSKKNLVALKHDGKLVDGPYSTKQPPCEKKRAVKLSSIDIAIVPGVAFDKKGNRIGYGKGYYDRLLSKIDAKKVGLAYGFQVFENLPAESHDIKVDYIVTENRVIKC